MAHAKGNRNAKTGISKDTCMNKQHKSGKLTKLVYCMGSTLPNAGKRARALLRSPVVVFFLPVLMVRHAVKAFEC